MKKINMNISANIKNYMDFMGMEPAELAKRLGCSPSTVYMWMQGNSTPRMDKIDRMCEIFGCSREDLISDKQATPDEIQDKQIMLSFYKKFNDLNPEMRLRLLTYMDTLYKLQEEDKEDDDGQKI